MAEIRIPIRDLTPLVDEDLTALDPATLASVCEKAFRFLPDDAQIEIEGDTIVIRTGSVSSAAEAEADRLATKAARRAAQGDYQKAVGIFEAVLELNPSHPSARRDLAMALYEMGKTAEAKDALVEALRLSPDDPSGYVILGNIYTRFEDDVETAVRFYQTALKLDPNDPYALNSMGAALTEQGEHTEALAYFDKAIAAEPGFANAYYGKAQAFLRTGDHRASFAALQNLFEHAKLPDTRTLPMLSAARQQALDTARALSEGSEGFKAVQNLKQKVETESGFPVVEEEGDLDAQIAGRAQIAWSRGRDYHLITTRPDAPSASRQHITCHELMHIVLQSEARAVGTNRFFATTNEDKETALKTMANDLRRLERQGHDPDRLAATIAQLLTGACSFLFNAPIDYLIETRIAAEQPSLRYSQIVSLITLAEEAAEVTFNKEIRNFTPKRILKVNDILNGANALFLDAFTRGLTTFANRYSRLPTSGLSSRIYHHWKDRAPDLKPGGEYDLVDETAAVLGVEDWYRWLPDTGDHEIAESRNERKSGTTNPELLKAKEPASVFYLLDAIKRFDAMPADEIQKVGFDIARVGMGGLDYADPDNKYTISSLPTEKFSGLHLICLMFVAFKHIDPTLDSEMDLEEPYLTALSMYRSSR